MEIGHGNYTLIKYHIQSLYILVKHYVIKSNLICS